jgi:peptidyl-prolyl cis-trans isomerase B (cyclophilin B)
MSRRIARVASKKERQRRLARQAHQRRTERQAQRERRAKQLAVIGIVAVLVVAVGIGAAAFAGVFSPAKAKPSAAKATPSASASPSPSPSGTAAMVDGKCVYIKAGTAARKVSLPPATPDAKATYSATIATNRGTIVVDLLNSKAPCTVNSFVSLTDQKYYDNTPCQRLTTAARGIYVLQCGDPTGTGAGGPGYEFGSENLAGAKYPAGTVAMVNSPGAPDSNGSQFFLVYKNTPLPASYTPFGTIVSGLNIIQNVAKAGSDNSNGPGDGHPKEKVQIDSVTIKKT